MRHLILGAGPFVGSLLWGWLGDVYTTAGHLDFARLFLVPSGLGLAAAVLLYLAFHPEKRPAPAVEARAA